MLKVPEYCRKSNFYKIFSCTSVERLLFIPSANISSIFSIHVYCMLKLAQRPASVLEGFW